MRVLCFAITWLILGLLQMFLGVAHAADPFSPEVSYPKREALWKEWMTDFHNMKEKVAKELPGISRIEKHLLQGTLVYPASVNGAIASIPSLRKPQPPFILILFPEDRFLGKVWEEMSAYGDEKRSVSAEFRSVDDLLILRAQKINSLSWAALLGHEGYHALVFSETHQVIQTSEEYCAEEAVANIFEDALLRASDKRYDTLVKKAATEAGKKIVTKDGRINLKLTTDERAFDSIFGKVKSVTDGSMRTTAYSHGVLFLGLKNYYKGDTEMAFNHFAHYLCETYREMGIVR